MSYREPFHGGDAQVDIRIWPSKLRGFQLEQQELFKHEYGLFKGDKPHAAGLQGHLVAIEGSCGGDHGAKTGLASSPYG